MMTFQMLNLNKRGVNMNLYINKLKNILTNFFIDEYGMSEGEAYNEMELLEENKKLQIAYTTLGDNEELEINVFVNVREKRLEQVVSGRKINVVEYTNYGSLENMLNDLSHCDFEALTRLDDFDVDDLIIEDKKLADIVQYYVAD